MAISEGNVSDTGRLSGVRAAIVTGSSSGIGRGIALALAEAGARLVVCADLWPLPGNDEDAVSEAISEERRVATHKLILARHGVGRALFVRCDVSIESAERATDDLEVATKEHKVGEKVWGMADLVAETVRRAGRLDV